MKHPRLLAGRALVIVLCAILGYCARTACAADGWADQRIYGPLIFHADFSLTEYEPLMGEIAQIQQELIQQLQLPPATEPIQILLFRDRGTYRRYVAKLKQQIPDLPDRQALYVRTAGQGTVLAYRSSSLPTDLRHECTHALLHAVLPMVPLWLDEGLAEYFEVPPADRLTGNPHHNTVKWWMRLGQVPSMARLETKQLQDMGRAEYRDAYAYVHLLLNGPPSGRAELVSFLADIRIGTPPGQLSDRLGRLTSNLSGELVEHFKTFGN
jgi:hypothetical protein